VVLKKRDKWLCQSLFAIIPRSDHANTNQAILMATADEYGSAAGLPGGLRHIHAHAHVGTGAGLSPNRHLYADTRGALFPGGNPNQHPHDRDIIE